MSETARVDRVTKTFCWNGHRSTPLRNVSFETQRGQVVLLLGPSGSGKTTLLTLIAGLVKPTTGTVRLFGHDITSYSQRELQSLRAARIGFVFQTFHLIDALTALENVALALRFAGRSSKDAASRAADILRRFDIGHLTAKLPKTLSQGEKQRVAVARAIANDAELIIADEPTASLDMKQGMAVTRLLHDYAKKMNRSVVIASHDKRIEAFSDVVLHLKDGVLA